MLCARSANLDTKVVMAGSASGDFDNGDLSQHNVLSASPLTVSQDQTDQPTVQSIHERGAVDSHQHDNRGRPTAAAGLAGRNDQSENVNPSVMYVGNQLPDSGMSSSWYAIARSAQANHDSGFNVPNIGSGSLPMQSHGNIMQADTAPTYNTYQTGGGEVQRPVLGHTDATASMQRSTDPSLYYEQQQFNGQYPLYRTPVPSCDFSRIVEIIICIVICRNL